MIKLFFSRQFGAFLITGGIAAAVNFGSRIVYNLWMGYSSAIVLAYLTGMLTAFILAKLFVFTDGVQAVHRSAVIFVLVNVLGIAQTWAVSLLMLHIVLPALHITAYAPEIAHAVGVMAPVAISYLGHKYWTFR